MGSRTCDGQSVTLRGYFKASPNFQELSLFEFASLTVGEFSSSLENVFHVSLALTPGLLLSLRVLGEKMKVPAASISEGVNRVGSGPLSFLPLGTAGVKSF